MEKKSTIELVKEYTLLEKDIESKLLKLNKIRDELCRRFPTLENENEFKIKKLV